MAGVASFLFSESLYRACSMSKSLFLFLMTGGVLTASASVEHPIPASAAQESTLDSVRADLGQGRHWHAAQRLQAAFPDGPGRDEELTMLFARSEAGWENWGAVRELLEPRLAAGTVQGAEAWYLLGRAFEGGEHWEEAEAAFGEAVSVDQGTDSEWGGLALARRGMIRGRMSRFQGALADIRALGAETPVLADWVAMDVAERSAAQGAREETMMVLSTVGVEAIRRLGWDLPARALLASGDSTGAEAAFWSALPTLSAASDRIAAWDRVATLRMARGDSVGARGAFHQVLSLSSSGAPGLRAAEGVMRLGADSAKVALAAARAFAAAGRHAEALEAYDLMESISTERVSPVVVLATARSHLAMGHTARALSLATELGSTEDPDIGAPALSLRVQALRQLGRGAEARSVEDELVSRFPGRVEALEILFARANALESRGDREGAIRGYFRTAELAPAQDLAGQSRMKIGQLLMGLGRDEEALEVYEAYISDFPDGRRWDEAAFWAGRLMLQSGRREAALELLARLGEKYPLSYYTVTAGEILDEPYLPSIPEVGDSLPFPSFLRDGLARFDQLREAGLGSGASWEAEAMATRLRTDPDIQRRQGVMLRLALELNARGFTREGINLGWELRREGLPWDRALVSAVYPFPYRNVIETEARDRRVDPFLVAGLIRQESAFWVEARSRADARGLMQVLPTTGRELARSSGPAGFRPDDHLYDAEINVHLGIAFFVDMRRRFGEDLPIILSAYNAGPTRAARWREFPEARDLPVFVERIPFAETRGYVKNVTANRAIYAWLYGSGEGETSAVEPGRAFLP